MGRSLLPFSCWWCVWGAGRGTVRGSLPAAFLGGLFVLLGVLGGVQYGVGRLLPFFGCLFCLGWWEGYS